MSNTTDHKGMILRHGVMNVLPKDGWVLKATAVTEK